MNILLDFDPSDFLDGDNTPNGELAIDDRCIDIADNHFTVTANDRDSNTRSHGTTSPLVICCTARIWTIDIRAVPRGRVRGQRLS